MSKAAIFNTTVRPNFKKNNELDLNCLLEEVDKETLIKKVVGKVNVRTLTHRDTILMIALIQVTILDESKRVHNKSLIYDDLHARQNSKNKKNRLTHDELKDLLEIPHQIETKKRKISNLQGLEKEAENLLSFHQQKTISSYLY